MDGLVLRITRRAYVPVIGAAACTLTLAQPARTASPEGLGTKVRWRSLAASLCLESTGDSPCAAFGPPDGDMALGLGEPADLYKDLRQLMEYMLQEQDKCGGQLGYDADLRG
jgi:hypothetical protein